MSRRRRVPLAPLLAAVTATAVLLLLVGLGVLGGGGGPPSAATTLRAVPVEGRCAAPDVYLAQGRPDPCLTPGVIRTSDPAVICVHGYASRVRAEVTAAQWAQRRAEVYTRYGVRQPADMVIDHALPLEGGGSNDVTNLWPEDKVPARGKDKAEAGLHAAVCRPGQTTPHVRALQEAFLKQWRDGPGR